MLIWRERPKEESSSSLVTNKLIWYTILFCFSVQVFIQHRRESPCFHLTIYSDFHFPLAAMINDFRRSNLSSVNSETLWHWIYRMAHRIVEVWCEKKSAFETRPCLVQLSWIWKINRQMKSRDSSSILNEFLNWKTEKDITKKVWWLMKLWV